MVSKKEFLLAKYNNLKIFLMQQPFASKFSDLLPDVDKQKFADIVFYISMMFSNNDVENVIKGLCASHNIELTDEEIIIIGVAIGEFVYYLKTI